MASTHHAIDYIEINVADLATAKDFYGQAFGWTFTDYGPGYAGFRTVGREDEAGGLNPAGQPGPGGPFVLLYSEDLDASVAAVEGAGGRIIQAPYAFPGGRRFHFADPSGNELGVWTLS
ncbi:VOC family protein [Ornithinimicrobium sp. F0845]|uniref:VOC family protein n=1 Tax=Ornithinimicrobium sp. F0845 TaxID=2926412 RepID=UPI001FF66992|nr:VOC family protein [Ornithinimicrobium sp. F0845]MCK0112371.1 VOC family protein [Ornithinimicrobium sp. F0845]